MVCALIGWRRRLRKQCNTSEPVPVFAKKTTPAPMSASARPPLTPEFQCCQRPPLACARLRKKTTLLVPSPPAPWINIEIRGERGGHWLCKRKCGRVVFFANTGLGILCLCALSQRISGRARASRVYTRPINGPLSRLKKGRPRARASQDDIRWQMWSGTRVVLCAPKGANPRWRC